MRFEICLYLSYGDKSAIFSSSSTLSCLIFIIHVFRCITAWFQRQLSEADCVLWGSQSASLPRAPCHDSVYNITLADITGSMCAYKHLSMEIAHHNASITSRSFKTPWCYRCIMISVASPAQLSINLKQGLKYAVNLLLASTLIWIQPSDRFSSLRLNSWNILNLQTYPTIIIILKSLQMQRKVVDFLK